MDDFSNLEAVSISFLRNKVMFTAFETEITIRPDDIDYNNHVHSTKYLDYVLAARFVQMRENYKMSMDEFVELGYNWFVSTIHIDYKRALVLEDKITVRTQIESVSGAQVKVLFRIVKQTTKKISAEGYFFYTMVDKSGKPVRIPQEIIERYSI